MMTTRIMAVAIVLVAVCLLAALTPGLWAQTLQQQTVTPPGGTDAPRSLTEAQQTATAQGGLIWFTNQAEFEAFMQGQGDLTGSEDFEESILKPNLADPFDDPLEFCVPNLPDGFPFPVAMTGLPNLIVQSNLDHNPGNPNPRGVNGVGALSVGFSGIVSDVVLATNFEDSLDLIFTDEKSAVGFNTINVVGGGTAVNVRVYIESEFPAARVWRGEFQDLLKPILWIVGRCQARRPSRAV